MSSRFRFLFLCVSLINVRIDKTEAVKFPTVSVAFHSRLSHRTKPSTSLIGRTTTLSTDKKSRSSNLVELSMEPKKAVDISVKDKSKSIQLKTITLYIGTTILFSKIGLLGPYTNDLILSDLGFTVLVGIVSVVFVKSITALASNGILQPRDSRKIIHTLSAPSFMIFWPFFSNAWGARFFVAAIPILQVVRLWLAGVNQGGSEGDKLAKAISRSGDSDEVLRGPLTYAIVLFVLVLTLWRDDLSVVMTLSAMAAGDGAADLVGRRLGKNNKWWFLKNQDKSIAGSLGFLVASTLCSIGMVWWFNYNGVPLLSDSFQITAGKFALISAFCAMVELIPIGDDNWTVPISAVIVSKIIF